METTTYLDGQSWIDYHCVRARDLYRAGEYHQALTCAEAALRVWPDNPFLMKVKGQALSRLGRSAEAVITFRAAKKAGFFDQEISNLLGIELMLQGYYHAALKEMAHLRLMTAQATGYQVLFFRFCQALTGETAPVIEFCDLLDSMDAGTPEDEAIRASSVALRSLSLRVAGDLQGSLALIRPWVETGSDHLFVAYAAGSAAMASGDPDLAEGWLRAAVTQEPRGMQARHDLASLPESRGRSAEADLVRAEIPGFFGPATMDPDGQIRAEELIRSGSPAEALQILGSAAGSHDPAYFITLMRALSLTGDPAGVLRVAASLPDTPAYWQAGYLKVAAWIKEGKADEAYREIVSLLMRDGTACFQVIDQMAGEGFFSDFGDLGRESMILDVLIRDGPQAAIPLLEAFVAGDTAVPAFHYLAAILRSLTGEIIDPSHLPAPEDPGEHMVRVFLLRTAGCMVEGEEAGERMIREFPDSAPAYYHSFLTLIGQDRYRDVS